MCNFRLGKKPYKEKVLKKFGKLDDGLYMK